MQHWDELHALIADVRRRWVAVMALRTIGGCALAVAAAVAGAAGVARLVGAEGPALIALMAMPVLCATGLAGYVIRRLPPPPSDQTTARFIEEQALTLGFDRLDDTLVSAVQFGESASPHGDPFAAAVVSQAATRVRAVPPSAIVPISMIRRAAIHAAAGVTCFVAATVIAIPSFGRAVDSVRVALFPQTVRISVLPGDARVVTGQPLRIRASLSRGGARLRGVAPSLTVSAAGQQRTVPMAADGDGYQFSFDSVDRSFTYKVASGAAASQSYAVTALSPPRVERIDIQYDYPAFSGLPQRTDEAAGDIYGPAGTRVLVSVHTDKPIAGGQLALGDGAVVQLGAAGGRVVKASLTLSKDDVYRVELSDLDGLRSSGDTQYFIRLMDDRPPEVRILRPAADQTITPLEEVSIEARADDDYGISRFELVYSVPGREERTVPFTATTGTSVAKIGTHLLAAEDLRVQPGDVIAYYARARDIGRGKRPSETRSDIFFLEVKPFGEEFAAAQSQAMGGGGASAQLETLIAAQKEIINATWNLERRSAVGQSAEDIKAVAQAQAELRARAEQMTSSRRRGRPNAFVPQQVLPTQRGRERGAAGDPVGAAVEAMTRALEQLEGERMRAALPHEMAALQGLLRAQAEVRRRQVAQQSASGASQGGTNRMGQDLSALFDRELQRQQRTNYETRSQIEERPDQRNSDSALERIRDLARRQDDLSRRQREVSEAELSPETLRRQLETLTREQETLRAQAEALERELGSRRSEGETASQQMREAAGKLQKQDARGAADRARDAAEGLRRLEQQLKGNSAEARQRAAGELQLEAQQVAEAQRRIAADTSRLQDGNAATSDALRRLAAEKEKLADRVEELRGSARQLAMQPGRPGTDGPTNQAREAAATLDREDVGRRMRELAQQMRGSAAGGRTTEKQARTAQEIARALDRAAAELNGRTADTQALAERLEQTGAMRERLNRLEQQVRDAEAGQRRSQGAQAQPGHEGQQGRRGQRGSAGSGAPGDVQRLRDDYARELERTRGTLQRLQGEQRSGQSMSTPETHEYSRSAPGTEAFKQDYAGWEALRRDIDLALESYEASAARQPASAAARDRLAAGGSERVPDIYRQAIARYYQSLANVKR